MLPLIEIKNCSLKREDQTALDGIDLNIGQKESVAILGPNGSGKSSLLKLITRELYPLDRKQSYIRILGETDFDIRTYRNQIGIVSLELQQTYNLNTPGLEVVISGFFNSNSLWQHFDIHDQHISQARALMRDLELESLEDRVFGQLSTGQQRKLLLARALVHKPNSLILDEPTIGLDLNASSRYLQTIRSLLNSGTSIILVTHHIEEIPPEIDRIVFLQEGKIIGDGSRASMLTDKKISDLFQTPVCLSRANGYYHARQK